MLNNNYARAPSWLAWAALAWAAAPSQAGPSNPAEGTGPDRMEAAYHRAEDLLRATALGKLKNGLIVPHWLSGRDEFWYRRDTAGGHDFVLVDAATGKKSAAFDHQAAATALSTALGKAVAADQLPISTFSYAKDRPGRRLSVTVEGRQYDCDLAYAHCKTIESDPALEGLLIAPNGRWAVSTRDGNLWLHELREGRERPLTSDGKPNDGYGIYYDGWKAAYIPRERAGKALQPLESYWAPDSSKVIVSRVDQRHIAEYPFVESTPRDGSFRPKLHGPRLPLVGEKPATLEWYVFDVPSGQGRRLEFPYDQLLVTQQDLLAVRKTWWSRDNRRLYAVAFGANMGSAFFFEADLQSGTVRTLIEEHATPRVDLNSTSYNPPNVRLVGDGRQIIWFSERDGWGHLYLYDAKSGALKNQITRGAWLVRDILNVDERRNRVYFSGAGREPGNPYYRSLYRANLDGSDLRLLSPEAGGDHPLTSPWNDVLSMDGAPSYEVVSPSGKYVVYTYSPIDREPTAIIRRTSDGGLVSVFEKADASRLFATGYRPPEEFVVKAADGTTDLWGVMYKPSDFDPAKRYPVIDVEYASPLTAIVPRNFTQAVYGAPGYGSSPALAELGFVVISIDARGTAFRSREFSQHGYGQLNINGLDDHVTAIKSLAASHPFLNASRVGITGGSYGGWSSLRGVLEFPDFFKVAMAGVPPGSMQSMYLDYHWTTFQGAPVYADGGELRPAAAAIAENWRALDGRAQASRLKAKILIMMGELDENALPGATLQLIDAFIKANRDFDLLFLPDRNHYETLNPYVIRHVWDYFVRNLEGEQPPREYDLSVKPKR